MFSRIMSLDKIVFDVLKSQTTSSCAVTAQLEVVLDLKKTYMIRLSSDEEKTTQYSARFGRGQLKIKKKSPIYLPKLF